MKFQSVLAMVSLLSSGAVSTPVASPDTAAVEGTSLRSRDVTCHRSNDSIGKTCELAVGVSAIKQEFDGAFVEAADRFCDKIVAQGAITEGTSSPMYLLDQPDGFGGQQMFWGNYRVDRGGDRAPDKASCHGYMQQIARECGGYGGWVDTDFGTVFGECIRQ